MVSVDYVIVSPHKFTCRDDAYELLAIKTNTKLIGRNVKEVKHHEVICDLEKGLDNATVLLSAQITYND